MKEKTKIGNVYGRLVVIKKLESVNKFIIWLCKCECGFFVKVPGYRLRNGGTKSCGCLQKELLSKRRTTHGLSKTRLYKIWDAMKYRTLVGSCHAYKDYGGRGIDIDKKWLDFNGFLEDMGSTYKDNLTIDRIDNSKGYSKENCRWVTKKEQQKNKRSNVYYELNGVKKMSSEWERYLGISKGAIKKRIGLGWPMEKILTTKSRNKKL